MSNLPIEVDDVDKRIITELQRDGRISYADLAPIVGLSPAATRQRVQRILDSGIVKVVGVTDPQALGYPVMGMLGVRVAGDVHAIADAIAEVEGVIYIVFASGRFDLLVEMIAGDTMAMMSAVNDKIRAIDGVRQTENFLYFGTHTHRFAWSVR